MIHIDRSRVSPSENFLERAEWEFQEAAAYYLNPDRKPGDDPFPFKAFRDSELNKALFELFSDKCAFCESPLGLTSPTETEHFRPKSMAVNLDGVMTKPGYWWLAAEWSNLYSICIACNRAKASRFPILGERAEYAPVGELVRIADEPIRDGNSYQSPIVELDVAEASNQLFALNADGALLIWDLPSGRFLEALIEPMNLAGIVAHIAVDPHGEMVVIGTNDGGLYIWELDQAQPRLLTEEAEAVTAVGISPDGKWATAGYADGRVSVHELEGGIHSIFSGHQDRINDLVITPDSRWLITASEDTTLGAWSLSEIEPEVEGHILLGHTSPVFGVDVMGDSQKVVSIEDMDRVCLWDIESGDTLMEFIVEDVGYRNLAMSEDGRFAVASRAEQINVIDIYTRRVIESVVVPEGSQATTVSPDGRFVLAGTQTGSIAYLNLDNLGEERALLLDPCRDDPETYLVFDREGYVASVPPETEETSSTALTDLWDRGEDRGQITIDVFGLNRTELVQERKRIGSQVLGGLSDNWTKLRIGEITGVDFIGWFDGQVDDRKPYAGMRRQVLVPALKEVWNEVSPGEFQDIAASIEEIIDQFEPEEETTEKAFKRSGDLASRRKKFTVEEKPEDAESYFMRSHLVTKIEIENFRVIEELNFRFGDGTASRTGWKVLLGENGVGKSSILAAVALTLMGQERIDQLKEAEIEDVVGTDLLRRGADEGFVKVFFATESEPIVMKLTPDGLDFGETWGGLRTYLLGFGSARWLPRPPKHENYETDEFVRVGNLFNPFVPLADAIGWLVGLKKGRQHTKYRKVEEVLTRLLLREPGTRFPMHKGRIYIKPPDKEISESDRLDQLSDGNQTILAIAISIMQMLGDRYDLEMEIAEGLVLLDEIGSHLHPRWKLRILESLRSAFPAMQFLATTHEPLCLRGLYDGEILLLRQSDERIIGIDNLESPDHLSVDRLLTSPLFGLMTTLDAEAELSFKRYYELLAIPADDRKPEEDEELIRLQNELGRGGYFGDTKRERVAYEIADELLARQSPEEPIDPDNFSPETLNLVADLWDQLE